MKCLLMYYQQIDSPLTFLSQKNLELICFVILLNRQRYITLGSAYWLKHIDLSEYVGFAVAHTTYENVIQILVSLKLNIISIAVITAAG